MKIIMYNVITAAVLLMSVLFAVAAEPYQYSSSQEQIRVAILRAADSAILDGDGLLATDENNRPIPLELPVTVRNDRGKVQIGNGSGRIIRVAGAGMVRLNAKSYRGLLEFSSHSGGLLVVNELPLEQYLVGVINSEISSTWPMESIKTQAVIARTYAVAKKRERHKAFYHLESTVMDQAYDGSDLEDSRSARGVHETDGEVLTYNGKVIQAFYHANSGGSTEASQNVWGVGLPYLQGVECQYGLTSPTSRWELTLPLSRIEAALKAHKVNGLVDITTGPRNNRGRLKTVQLVTEHGIMSMPATRFRMTVGSTIIRSTNFTVRVQSGNAFFSGAGYGHGVGLCQYGAKQRALDGFTYTEILSYYYPGTKLSTLSDIK